MKEKVLIRGVNWVGDAVMSMPAIRAVRRAYPGAHISLLVKPWVAPLFDKSPDIDEAILYDEKFKGIGGRLRLAEVLRRERFDRAILLQNAFDAALIAYLARIPERVGFGRDFRSILLTNAVEFGGEDRRMRHIDYYLELLKRAGIDAPYSDPWIHLSLEERLEARERLGNLKRPLVGINPGAQFGPAKQWMPERFASLITRIVEDLGGSAVVLGGPGEAALAGSILSASSADPSRAISMAGRTTLRELAALVSECEALVTTDSGPMHIGYATGTPLVAIFGSTSPALTGPVGYGHRVIQHMAECAPCFERKCGEEDKMRCMEAVTVDEVFETLRQLLPTRKAVLFDRDGTLCEYVEFLDKWQNFKVMDDINQLNRLVINDYKLIGITNQSGIARGIVEEDFVKRVNSFFIEKHGFGDFYYCPHHPDEHCPCRKPEPGMLLRARAEHGVDLRSSYVVGDRETDMQAARAGGAKAVLIKSPRVAGPSGADFEARSLAEAVDWILEN
jgi:heptosyltransferase-2